MKVIFKFVLYLFVCIVVAFFDFYYNLRGLITLLFDVLLVFILILSKQSLNFRFVKSTSTFYGFLILILIAVIINFVDIGLNNKTQIIENHIDFFLLSSIIIKSLTEEIIYRGFWLNNMIKNKNLYLSILIISFGFAFLHYFSGNDPIFAFLASCIISIVYIKTKSILNVYIVHVLNNIFILFIMPMILELSVNTDIKNVLRIGAILILVVAYLIKQLLKDKKN